MLAAQLWFPSLGINAPESRCVVLRRHTARGRRDCWWVGAPTVRFARRFHLAKKSLPVCRVPSARSAAVYRFRMHSVIDAAPRPVQMVSWSGYNGPSGKSSASTGARSIITARTTQDRQMHRNARGLFPRTATTGLR